MTEPFVAEIRIFPFNFAPTGWALCNGQLLPLSQNTALFSLLGTTYGGDGKSTFALPDLNGRAPMHPGQGPGLSMRFLGEQAGEEAVTLLTSEMTNHAHTVRASGALADSRSPASNVVLARSKNAVLYQTDSTNLKTMDVRTAAPSGGGAPHNNLQPYLVLNFCIALQGVFPPRP